MRTGSIGNRDAETLLNTLVEPKKSILKKLRNSLLELGYSEDAGFDAINIESFVSYSKAATERFFLKHKWRLVVIAIFLSKEEFDVAGKLNPQIVGREVLRNDENEFLALEIDPATENSMIISLAEYFSKSE